MTSSATSTSAVVTSLTSNLIFFGIFVGSFLVLRLKFKRIYSPKSATDLVPIEKRPPPLPKDPIRWLWVLLSKDDKFFLQYLGLDGFFFLRFLKVFTVVFLVGVSTYVVLLPVNAVKGYNNPGFDLLSISNVSKPSRYYAHVFIGWIFYGLVIFVINRELFFYNSLRCAALSTPKYAKSLASRTVLFQSVPDVLLDSKQFFKMFNGVRRIYVARTWRKLASKVRRRENLAYMLENAENKLLKKATKAKLKSEKKSNTPITSQDINDYVPENKRPRHRANGRFKPKVDTINYCLEEIAKLDIDIKKSQKRYKTAKPKNSIFVEFENQYMAQIAYQSVIHHSPLRMSPSFTGLSPSDVLWNNLRIFWWEKVFRRYIALAAVVALIILWAIPVAFVGVISNLTYLTNIKAFHWLRFVYNLPPQLLGIITGLLPTVMLALLTYFLPIIIRGLAKVSGSPSLQSVELFTQRAYFGFLIVNSFLVTALSSSATSTVTRIVDNPSSALNILANGLPKSSNFYISYIILQGLSITGAQLLQLVGLVLYFLLSQILDTTVRKKWARFSGLGSMAWGTTFPIYTNLVCITLAYSIISPLILAFAAIAMLLIYITFAYNLTYCFTEENDARGRHYPEAIMQVFTGIYLGQICLLGIMVVGKGWGPIVLQIIGLGFTVFSHIQVKMSYDNLLDVVPIDCMRPLDGVSNTPSFAGTTEYEAKVLSKRHHHQPRSPFIPIDKESDELEHEHEHDEKLEDNFVPLLADRDNKKIGHSNFLVRFLRPDIFFSFKQCKTLLPDYYYEDPADSVDDKHAFDDPIISMQLPKLWIPKDDMGLSTIEIEKLSSVIEVDDYNSGFDKKGKIACYGPPE